MSLFSTKVLPALPDKNPDGTGGLGITDTQPGHTDVAAGLCAFGLVAATLGFFCPFQHGHPHLSQALHKSAASECLQMLGHWGASLLCGTCWGSPSSDSVALPLCETLPWQVCTGAPLACRAPGTRVPGVKGAGYTCRAEPLEKGQRFCFVPPWSLALPPLCFGKLCSHSLSSEAQHQH